MTAPVVPVGAVGDRMDAGEASMRLRCAEYLADEVDVLIRRKIIDSRSPAADALLDYRSPPSTPRSDRLAVLENLRASEAAMRSRRPAPAESPPVVVSVAEVVQEIQETRVELQEYLARHAPVVPVGAVDRLAPCPFCGGNARLLKHAMEEWSEVVCANRCQSQSANAAEAIAAWSLRASEAALREAALALSDEQYENSGPLMTALRVALGTKS